MVTGSGKDRPDYLQGRVFSLPMLFEIVPYLIFHTTYTATPALRKSSLQL